MYPFYDTTIPLPGLPWGRKKKKKNLQHVPGNMYKQHVQRSINYNSKNVKQCKCLR